MNVLVNIHSDIYYEMIFGNICLMKYHVYYPHLMIIININYIIKRLLDYSLILAQDCSRP